ncbi:hypothetical protein [Shouchella patagoniensis]|nr:hypothetical protein [Shouchella patagoniensis]
MAEEHFTKQQTLAEIIKQHSLETGKCSTCDPTYSLTLSKPHPYRRIS